MSPFANCVPVAMADWVSTFLTKLDFVEVISELSRLGAVQ
jgi:hypothetical protein